VYHRRVPGPRTFYFGDVPLLVHNCLGLKRPGIGRIRSFARAWGPAAVMFLLPFVTDALRATSWEDFGKRSLNTLLTTALFLPAGILIAGLCPPCGVALAVVGTIMMLYELASAIEDKVRGEKGVLSQFSEDVSWWLTGVFHPNMFSDPIAQPDQNAYYD
jgi:hypothetical protein